MINLMEETIVEVVEDSIITVFSTANWILLFLGIYMVVIIAMGLLYKNRVEDCDDLCVAGRKLSFVFMVPSVVATWICAGAMMGAAGYALLYGMQGIIFDPWAPALCMVIIGVFFAFRMRKAKYTTVTDFFNSRYNKLSGSLYTIIQVLSGVGWLGGQLVALGIIVHLTTGFSLGLAVVIATVVIIVVTYFGGLWALSRVDTIGFILIIVGLLILLPAALGQVGGLSGLIATGENWAELPTWSMKIEAPEDGGYLWYTGILAILLYISAWTSLSLGDVPSQVLMQRALAAKDEKTAVAGFLTSGVIYLIIGMFPVMIGIAVFTSGDLGWVVDMESQAENVLPWAAYNYLPPWASILFIVTLAAAIVSTSGNTALVISTMLGHNVYRMFKPTADNIETLRIVRISIPIVSLLAMAIALYFETVYRLIILSGGIQLATIAGAYIIGTFWKKANATGAVASFFTGLVSWILLFIFWAMPATEFFEEDAIFIAMVPAAFISFLTVFVVSALTQKSDPAKPMLTQAGEDMSNAPKFFWSKGAQ